VYDQQTTAPTIGDHRSVRRGHHRVLAVAIARTPVPTWTSMPTGSTQQTTMMMMAVSNSQEPDQYSVVSMAFPEQHSTHMHRPAARREP